MFFFSFNTVAFNQYFYRSYRLISPLTTFTTIQYSFYITISYILLIIRSVDVLAHLGGKGLAPYYCLIEGGEKGWLINEMKDLFYYAQILHQGENVITPRLISDKVSTKEVPNLMRVVGYYPSNEEVMISLFIYLII